MRIFLLTTATINLLAMFYYIHGIRRNMRLGKKLTRYINEVQEMAEKHMKQFGLEDAEMFKPRAMIEKPN